MHDNLARVRAAAACAIDAGAKIVSLGGFSSILIEGNFDLLKADQLPEKNGTAFTTGDLATPKINVAYGSYYLRYLLDHYEGNEMLAVAAYNGGLANVDEWVAKAREAGRTLSVSEIPFPETQAYVEKVMRAQREYRAVYPRQLGLT